MTEEQIKFINEQKRFIDVVINHNLEVQKSNDTVKKILDISTELGHPICKTCPHAIQDAFRVVWMEYKKQFKAQENEH